jgi:hypothetical protein
VGAGLRLTIEILTRRDPTLILIFLSMQFRSEKVFESSRKFCKRRFQYFSRQAHRLILTRSDHVAHLSCSGALKDTLPHAAVRRLFLL